MIVATRLVGAMISLRFGSTDNALQFEPLPGQVPAKKEPFWRRMMRPT